MIWWSPCGRVGFLGWRKVTEDTDDFLRRLLSTVLDSPPSVGLRSSPKETVDFCSKVLSLLSVVLLSVVLRLTVSPGAKYSGFTVLFVAGETSESGLREAVCGAAMVSIWMWNWISDLSWNEGWCWREMEESDGRR